MFLQYLPNDMVDIPPAEFGEERGSSGAILINEGNVKEEARCQVL